MSNVSRGFAYEREVKKHFVDVGWGCTRAAHSASVMDLIAFTPTSLTPPHAYDVLKDNGYTIKDSASIKIPLRWLASKIEKTNIKHIYYDMVRDWKWVVVLMQCKIGKRR